MKSFVSILAILAILSLGACTNMQVQEGKKGQVGGVGGAAAGAIIGQAIGHNTEATLIGAAIGGLLGYIVGNEMDKYDLRELNHVYERGASNRPSSWVNPDTGNQYTVVPQPAYTDPNTRRVCRKAEIDAVIDGKMQKTYATACRDAYGHWQLQK
jgi:surface antigen